MTDYWRKARGEKITPDERQLLFDLAQQVSIRFEQPTIVNIGVSWGASLHCLVAGAPEANHIAIDVDYEKRPIQGFEFLVYHGILFCTCKSEDFFRREFSSYSDESLHLVFVDGCHSYKCVKADNENFTPHIPVGGIIAFHDYRARLRDRRQFDIGVWRAVREWRKDNDEWDMLDCRDSIVAFERVI